MKAPKKVMELVKKKAEERKKHEELIRKTRELKSEKARKLHELRMAQIKELQKEAKRILGFMVDFYESADGEAILNAASDIDFFKAKFWNGYPITEPNEACHAAIVFMASGEIVYEERHKGRVSHKNSLGRIYEPESVTVCILYTLHPDFLRQWCKAIDDGTVWDCIESSLK